MENRYWEGDCRAQLVWHVSWAVLQVNKHIVLAVALPVVVEKNRPLEFRPWRPGAKMALGVYDIPYPAEGKAVTPEALLVPMVGFDRAGYRLGYGGGYYDRTLAALPKKPLCIGISFALGRIDSIHPLPHDIPMDFIVTEEMTARRVGGRLQVL